eukprot:RCo037004
MRDCGYPSLLSLHNSRCRHGPYVPVGGVLGVETEEGTAGLCLRARGVRRQFRSARDLIWGSPAIPGSLRLGHTLKGHLGCVNTVTWSDSGALLVSGSDDRCVNVWDAARGFALRHRTPTVHSHNIFGAVFVPQSGDGQ